MHTIPKSRLFALLLGVALLGGVGSLPFWRVSAQSQQLPSSTALRELPSLRQPNIPSVPRALSIRQHIPVLPNPMMLQAMHQESSVIDGSVNPELIPDSVAYRLFFTVMTVSPMR